MNFTVRPGELVAVVGESGAGKSTLLHLLGGLDRPTDGSIYFGGRETTHLSDAELSEFRNQEIGFVWQSHGLLPEFTALENVMMPLLIRGMSRKKAAEQAALQLERVGLAARGHHRSGELSGGEQQRVALARALVTNPSVLLADEPTGNLDYRTGETIIGLLEELHRNCTLTSIVVTHNQAFARRCHRMFVLEKGRMLEQKAALDGAAAQASPVNETIGKEPISPETMVPRGTNGSTYV